MMKNVLVFPCGSEIALEIHRALANSTYFNLIGASSVEDHGRFIYEQYISGIPFVTDENFIDEIKKIVISYDVDYIYPAMDSVITIMKENEKVLGCYVISSSVRTAQICMSKELTYQVLAGTVKIPKIYDWGGGRN